MALSVPITLSFPSSLSASEENLTGKTEPKGYSYRKTESNSTEMKKKNGLRKADR
jgi:hypothetical protein